MLLDQNGETALMYASRYGLLKVVQLILSSPGVNANMQDKVNCSLYSIFVYIDIV